MYTPYVLILMLPKLPFIVQSGIIKLLMKVRSWYNMKNPFGWLMVGLFALTSAPVSAAISQGYPASTNIPAGTIVSLAADGSGKVVPTDATSANRIFGVVAPAGNSTITLGAASGQVLVTTSGIATVFVSTEAGNITSGDPITLSSIAGVGEKLAQEGRVVGIAEGSLTPSSPGVLSSTVGTGASKKQVFVGEININVGVTSYVVQTKATGVLGEFQGFANSVAGKQVNQTKLIIAGIILLVTLISVSVLLYSAVRNSIVAIGRNPLSRGSVFRSLIQVILFALVILAISSGIMYLVIR